ATTRISRIFSTRRRVSKPPSPDGEVVVSAHETLSEAWLKKAQSAVNADPSFRKRGSIDVKMAVKSDKSTYLVTFGGFSCHDVCTMTDAGLRDADFAIDMSDDKWERFLQGRRSGSGRTLVDIDTTD